LAASKVAIVRWVETGDLIREHGLVDSTELRTWNKVGVLGAIEILQEPALGLFCSIRCPGKAILAVYDLARALRDAGVPVISGFHTPMERECLDLLLRGEQPLSQPKCSSPTPRPTERRRDCAGPWSRAESRCSPWTYRRTPAFSILVQSLSRQRIWPAEGRLKRDGHHGVRRVLLRRVFFLGAGVPLACRRPRADARGVALSVRHQSYRR
jgi:hypothetical protein